MTYRSSLIILFIVFNFLYSASYAQNYAFTPFIGGRTSDTLEEVASGIRIDLDETSSAGFLLSMKKKRGVDYDFLFSRQNTELRSASFPGSSIKLRLDHFHLGGTTNYKVDDLHPFISGSIGATRIIPDNSNLSSETKMSLSIGGGIKIPFNQNYGLRLEIRWYGIVTDSNESVLCNDSGCVVRFNGSLFWQVEALAGFLIMF
jgi:hypothetical protein